MARSFAGRLCLRRVSTKDPVIGVEFARRARQLLEAAGLDVDYGESDVPHTIDPADIPRATAWLDEALAVS